jgi:SRSO17 transposase
LRRAGKIASCQLAVTTALLADQLAWPTTMEPFLPEDLAEDADPRARASPHLLNLPASALRRELVRLTRALWPIGQHYRELKDELASIISKDAVGEEGIIMR